MKGNRKMNKFGNFPFLVGVTSNRHAVKLENSTEAVADFICTKGVDGDLCILTPDGDKVLNTFGIYIDRCSDFDYLEKLRPVLVEKQLKLESSLGLGASLVLMWSLIITSHSSQKQKRRTRKRLKNTASLTNSTAAE